MPRIGTSTTKKRKECEDEACTKVPVFNFPGESCGRFCKQHSLEGMVDVKSRRCAHEGCEKYPAFNFPTETTSRFCGEHKQKGMVDVHNKRCAHPDCTTRPTFNIPGKPAAYCVNHRQDGMVNNRHKPCHAQGCRAHATFKEPGGSVPVYCAAHRAEGMVQARSRVCSEPGCDKRPSFNHSGKLPKYCPLHKSESMVDVLNRLCNFEGCTKLPSFNYPGCTPAVFCGQHKDPCMVNVRHKVCQQQGCGTEAKYNHPGATNGAYCGTHKDPGMVRVNSRKCEADGCDRRASFNYNGRSASYCGQHRKEGMVDVANRRCFAVGCSKAPAYNFPGEQRRMYCASHKDEGMVNLRKKRQRIEKDVTPVHVQMELDGHQIVAPGLGIPVSLQPNAKQEVQLQHMMEVGLQGGSVELSGGAVHSKAPLPPSEVQHVPLQHEVQGFPSQCMAGPPDEQSLESSMEETVLQGTRIFGESLADPNNAGLVLEAGISENIGHSMHGHVLQMGPAVQQDMNCAMGENAMPLQGLLHDGIMMGQESSMAPHHQLQGLPSQEEGNQIPPTPGANLHGHHGEQSRNNLQGALGMHSFNQPLSSMACSQNVCMPQTGISHETGIPQTMFVQHPFGLLQTQPAPCQQHVMTLPSQLSGDQSMHSMMHGEGNMEETVLPNTATHGSMGAMQVVRSDMNGMQMQDIGLLEQMSREHAMSSCRSMGHQEQLMQSMPAGNLDQQHLNLDAAGLGQLHQARHCGGMEQQSPTQAGMGQKHNCVGAMTAGSMEAQQRAMLSGQAGSIAEQHCPEQDMPAQNLGLQQFSMQGSAVGSMGQPQHSMHVIAGESMGQQQRLMHAMPGGGMVHQQHSGQAAHQQHLMQTLSAGIAEQQGQSRHAGNIEQQHLVQALSRGSAEQQYCSFQARDMGQEHCHPVHTLSEQTRHSMRSGSMVQQAHLIHALSGEALEEQEQSMQAGNVGQQHHGMQCLSRGAVDQSFHLMQAETMGQQHHLVQALSGRSAEQQQPLMQPGSVAQQQPLLHAMPSASAGQQQHLLPVALGQQHHLVHALSGRYCEQQQNSPQAGSMGRHQHLMQCMETGNGVRQQNPMQARSGEDAVYTQRPMQALQTVNMSGGNIQQQLMPATPAGSIGAQPRLMQGITQGNMLQQDLMEGVAEGILQQHHFMQAMSGRSLSQEPSVLQALTSDNMSPREAPQSLSISRSDSPRMLDQQGQFLSGHRVSLSDHGNEPTDQLLLEGLAVPPNLPNHQVMRETVSPGFSRSDIAGRDSTHPHSCQSGMHGHINLGQEQYLVEPPTPAQVGSETNFPRFPMMHVSGGVDAGGTRHSHEFLGATLGQTSSPGFTNMQVVMGNQAYDDGGYPDTIHPALHVHLHYVQMGAPGRCGPCGSGPGAEVTEVGQGLE
eukprot:jgi/Botrbrau1/8818/Bobra.0335s0008.1